MAKSKFESYGLGKPLKRFAPFPIEAARAPTTSDVNYDIGQNWVNTASGLAYMLTAVSSGSATWSLVSPGASDVDTINSLSPTAGNIIIDGGTNITDVNAGSTVTLNLDAAITLATSVTTPLVTAAAATDIQITAPTGQDCIIKLGDNAAANKLSVIDSDDVEVFAVDSNGGQTYTTITASGLITAQASMTVSTAGTDLNLGSDNSADAVNLGVGTTARAIGIGNSAAAHVVTIGSTTGAAQVIVNSGTAGIQMASTGAGDITLDSDDTLLLDADGVLELNSSAGAINIGNDADAQAINIGTGAAARTITMGNGTGVTSLVLDCGTGPLNIGTNAIAHTITMGNGTGATSLVLDCGTGALNIGTNAIAHTVTIGNVTGATAVNLNAGTGGIALASTGTGDITLDSDDALLLDADGVLELNSSAGAINIGNDADAQAINIGTGAAARTITMGNGTGATSLVLDCGTGPLNIGTNAVAHTTTIGNTTGASGVVIQAGTGDITMTGTVKEIDAEFLFASGTDLTVTQSPVMTTAANTGGAATGATGDVNLMYMQDGCLMEQFILGAGQTIIAPRMTANGLNLALDNTATEGAEYNFGARNNAKHAYTIGTSAAFFIEATVYVEDLSGCDPLMIGFRKVEANNATFANYTDYVGIGLNQVTSATNVVILDELNSGGQTATDTTDAWGGDASAQTVKVLVSAAGVVTFEVGGSAASAAPSFTFDSGDVVMPYIHFVQGVDVTSEVGLQNLKIGFQA